MAMSDLKDCLCVINMLLCISGVTDCLQCLFETRVMFFYLRLSDPVMDIGNFRGLLGNVKAFLHSWFNLSLLVWTSEHQSVCKMTLR